MKRDKIITGGELELKYTPLYEDIIYSTFNPNKIPQYIGQRWFNKTSKAWFTTSGTSLNADWVTPSGAVATSFRVATDENSVVTNVENIYQKAGGRMRNSQNVYTVTELSENPVGRTFNGETWSEIENGGEI